MQDILNFMQQHGALSIALVIVFVIIIIIELIRAKRASHQLTPNEATALINHQDAVVIDLRTYDVFTGGHIINAISLPYNDLKTKCNKLEKFKSKPIILTCAMGNESTKAAEELTEKGYDVRILKGGMRAWQLADLPVIKDK